MDHLGQTLLNWAVSFGSASVVELLCVHGANVDLGVRTSLDYAATFGRVDICRTLLNWGADIHKSDVQGKRPIDRARENPNFAGSQQVIDLLESEALRRLSKSTSSPTSNPADPFRDKNKEEYYNDCLSHRKSDAYEAQRIFVDKLMPLIVELFNSNSSLTIRHECILLVLRMIRFIQNKHLEEISLIELKSTPFAFLLTQMVYTILIEEPEEFVLRALELSTYLLRKCPHVYTALYYRLGLVPLIQMSFNILKCSLSNQHFDDDHLFNLTLASSIALDDSKRTSTYNKQTESYAASFKISEMDTILGFPNRQLLPNLNLYIWRDWNFICMGQILFVFSEFTCIIIKLQESVHGLQMICIHSGSGGSKSTSPLGFGTGLVTTNDSTLDSASSNYDLVQIPIELHPNQIPFKRPAFKHHMLRIHRHLFNLFANHTPFQPLFDCDPNDTNDDSNWMETNDGCILKLAEQSQTTEIGKMELNDQVDIGNFNLDASTSDSKAKNELDDNLKLSNNSSDRNTKTCRANVERFRIHMGLRQEPQLSENPNQINETSVKIHRHLSSPARACLNSKFVKSMETKTYCSKPNEKLVNNCIKPDQVQTNNPNHRSNRKLLTYAYFGPIELILVNEPDNEHVCIKSIKSDNSASTEALLLLGHSTHGFKRVRVVSMDPCLQGSNVKSSSTFKPESILNKLSSIFSVARDGNKLLTSSLNSINYISPNLKIVTKIGGIPIETNRIVIDPSPIMLIDASSKSVWDNSKLNWATMESKLELEVTKRSTKVDQSNPELRSFFGKRNRLKLSRRCSTNFMELLTELDRTLHLPKSDMDVPEIFNFDALICNDLDVQLGDDKLDDTNDNEISNTPKQNKKQLLEQSTIDPAMEEELNRIDQMFFPNEIAYVTYDSGKLQTWLESVDNNSRNHFCIERSILIRKQALIFSKFLLDQLFVDRVRIESDRIQIPCNLGLIGNLDRVHHIVSLIWLAFDTNNNNNNNTTNTNTGHWKECHSLLSQAFQLLANLLAEGEQSLTCHELMSGGLVQALLLCLAMAKAGKWTNSSTCDAIDSDMSMLWKLQQRRYLFVKYLLGTQNGNTLGLFIRQLVKSFEFMEQLPLKLYSLIEYSQCNSMNCLGQTMTSCLFDEQFQLSHDNGIDRSPSCSIPLNLIKSIMMDQNRNGENYPNNNKSRVNISMPVNPTYQNCIDSQDLSVLWPFNEHLTVDKCALDQIRREIKLRLERGTSSNDMSKNVVKDGQTQLGLTKQQQQQQEQDHNKDDTGVAKVTGQTLDQNLLFMFPLLVGAGEEDKSELTGIENEELIDWTGKTLDLSVLTTCGQLDNFIRKVSTKQWYEYPRTSLNYWRQVQKALNSKNSYLTISYNSLNLGNSSVDYLSGVIDWLATDGNHLSLENWINPSVLGLVSVAASTNNPIKGRPLSVLGPLAGSVVGSYTIRGTGIGVIAKPRLTPSAKGNDKTNCKELTDAYYHEAEAWIALDMGLQLWPTAYTLGYLRHARITTSNVAPRNWRLEASNDALNWVVLREHVKDESIQSVSGSHATWNLDLSHLNATQFDPSSSSSAKVGNDSPKIGWRFFKIQSTGPNADGLKELGLGGIEFYGHVYATYETVITPGQLSQLIYYNSSKTYYNTVTSKLSSKSSSQSTGTQVAGTSLRSFDYDKSIIPHLIGNDDQFLKSFIENDNNWHSIDADPNLDMDLKIPNSNRSRLLDRLTNDSFNKRFLRCLDDILVDDKSSLGINRLLRRISDQQVGSKSSIRCSLDNLIGKENSEYLPNYLIQSLTHHVPKRNASEETVIQETKTFPLKDEMESQPRNKDLIYCNLNINYNLNPVDAEALEFADTIEAIIQKNTENQHVTTIGSSDNFIAPNRVLPNLGQNLSEQMFMELLARNENETDDRRGEDKHDDLDDDFEDNGEEDDNDADNDDNDGDGKNEVNDNYDPIRFKLDISNCLVESQIDPQFGTEFQEAINFADCVDKEDKQSFVDENNVVQNEDQVGEQPTTGKKESELVVINTNDHVDEDLFGETNDKKVTTLSQPILTSDTFSTMICQNSSTNSNRHQRLLSKRWRRSKRRPVLVNEFSGIPKFLGPKKICPNTCILKNPIKSLPWKEITMSLLLPSGLITTFNPNPRATNALATTFYALPNPITNEVYNNEFTNIHSKEDKPKDIVLYLCFLLNSECILKIPLIDKDISLFNYMQQLCIRFDEWIKINHPNCQTCNSNRGLVSPKDKSNKEMEGNDEKISCKGNYAMKLIYKYETSEDESIFSKNKSTKIRTIYGKPLLSKNDLRFTPCLNGPIIYLNGAMKLLTQDENFELSMKQKEDESRSQEEERSRLVNLEDILQLLKVLYQLSGLYNVDERNLKSMESNADLFTIRSEDFESSRLTEKLLHQIHDPLALASGTLPDWCLNLGQQMPFLIKYDARHQFFTARAFGPARAVIWLQNHHAKNASSFVSDVCNNAYCPVSNFNIDQSFNKNDERTSYELFRKHFVISSLLKFLLRNYINDPIGLKNDVPLIRNPIFPNNDATTSIETDTSNGIAENIGDINDSSLHQASTHSDASNGRITSDRNQINLSPVESIAHTMAINLLSTICPNGWDISNQTDLLNSLLMQSQNYLIPFHTYLDDDRSVSNNQNVDKDNVEIGRLHKEFVRFPRSNIYTQFGQSQPDESIGTAGDSPTFWDWASLLMEEHARRKSKLEIQFTGEEGTGLGPTLEFYSLLAAELRRHDYLMWISENDASVNPSIVNYGTNDSSETMGNKQAIPTMSSSTGLIPEAYSADLVDPNISVMGSYDNEDISITLDKEADVYVNTSYGLFPVPWPGDQIPQTVLHRFYILGITVAKCLQDNRRIELPFSNPFLKLLLAHGRCADWTSPVCTSDEISVDKQMKFSHLSEMESALMSNSIINFQSMGIGKSTSDPNLSDLGLSSTLFHLTPPIAQLMQFGCNLDKPHWISGLLGLDDFCLIYSERAQFMHQIVEFVHAKRKMEQGICDGKKLSDVATQIFGCPIEDLYLSMEFVPHTLLNRNGYPLKNVYDWESQSLEESFDQTADTQNKVLAIDVSVSMDNIEDYFKYTLALCLDKGIRKQMDAFRNGFERVFSLSWLALFNVTELGQLISGDSVLQWTREDLLAYTLPILGFTKQSKTYIMLINVLNNFNMTERRAFLQFTTGCSSLPPGGLKNLYPRLRIVRKEHSDSGPYPSVNTCVHYLKLPEYQSELELRVRLLQATREYGFYLN